MGSLGDIFSAASVGVSNIGNSYRQRDKDEIERKKEERAEKLAALEEHLKQQQVSAGDIELAGKTQTQADQASAAYNLSQYNTAKDLSRQVAGQRAPDWNNPDEQVIGVSQQQAQTIGAKPTIGGMQTKTIPQLSDQFNLPQAGAYNEAAKAESDIVQKDKEQQNKLQIEAVKNTVKKGQGSEPFQQGTPEFEIAKRIASENIPVSRWLPLFTSLGGGLSLNKPRILSTVSEQNPEYDFVGNELNFAGDVANRKKEATLTPSIIGKEGELSHARAMATNSPDVGSAKAINTSMGRSATNNQVKIDNSNAALALFSKVLDHSGNIDPEKTKTLSPVNVGELFMSTAKMLNAQGVLSDSQLKEVSQPTIQGDISKITQYFGHQFGGATSDDVLENMYDLIKREGRQAQRAINSVKGGSGQSFEGDSQKKRKVWNEQTGAFE